MLKRFFYIFIMLGTCNKMETVPPFLATKSTWAEETLKTLTLRQKIGQLFIIAAASKSASEQPESLASAMHACPYVMDCNHIKTMIQDYNIGGVIFLYKSDPATQMVLTEKFQKLSSIPLLIAQDCEWGLSMRLDIDPTNVIRYPRNMTLGALADKQLVYEIGNEIGKQCAVIGVHMNFAPVVDVNNNPKNPVIHDRSFGDDHNNVADLATLFAQGLQDAGIIACAKHFPGHGDTNVDSHFNLPVINHDKKRLNAIELFPFKRLIQKGVSSIMTAHLSVPAFDTTPNKPSSLSYAIITEELKNNLNFKGLVITDGLGMKAITKHYQPGNLELQAFLAGNDILLCPLDVPRAVELIEQAIQTGLINETELDQRVLKILKAKEWVLEKQKMYQEIDPLNYIIRPEAYALQKKLYRNAITLVKSSSNVSMSPTIIKNSCIIQIGNMPEQAFVKACKVYNETIHVFKAALSNEELKTCLYAATNKDTVIVAISQMSKFAQQNFGVADNFPVLITTLKEMAKKVVVIVFGTPYSLEQFKNADVLIEAYEDAVPAQEAAFDVLCGTLQATGKLPVHYQI